MKLRNRAVTAAAHVQVIAGIRQNLLSAGALPIGGRSFTAASLEAYFQGRLDASNAILAARAAWVKAIDDYESAVPEMNLMRRSLQSFVEGLFGAESPRLADFGFAPRKKAVLTDEKKVQAVAKRAATRKRRGTLGRKAKLAIKGQVPPPAGETK